MTNRRVTGHLHARSMQLTGHSPVCLPVRAAFCRPKRSGLGTVVHQEIIQKTNLFNIFWGTLVIVIGRSDRSDRTNRCRSAFVSTHHHHLSRTQHLFNLTQKRNREDEGIYKSGLKKTQISGLTAFEDLSRSATTARQQTLRCI